MVVLIVHLLISFLLHRCVKSQFITSGSYQPIWNDRGSGAYRDVGLFSNSEIGNYKAIFANTFTSVASHRTPSGSPLMLNGDNSILHSLLKRDQSENIAIKVYEGTDSDLIWKDSGSGGYHDISIFRPRGPSGYYVVGDIAIGNYGSPRTALLAKAMDGKEDVFANPTSFRRRWTDRGSGADWDVSFWEPICPYSYLPLGHAAVRSHGSSPPRERFACVKHTHVVQGDWNWVWNDRGTGANVDVSVYQAVAKDSQGQGMQAMGAVPRHGAMDRTAYVLKSNIVQYIIGKPANKYIISNVEYLFDDRMLLSRTPEELSRTIVHNQGSTVQTVKRTLAYTKEETSDWSSSFGLEIGIEVSVTAGIPSVASTTVSMALKLSLSIQFIFVVHFFYYNRLKFQRPTQ